MTFRELEFINVVCTGGTYDDPETGKTARHGRVKLGRLPVFSTKTTDGYELRFRLHPWGESRRDLRCRLCGRQAPVGASWMDGDEVAGGVWQRVLTWIMENHPERRVFEVDISDACYPWE